MKLMTSRNRNAVFRRPALRSRAGFSLIEVMIAVMILAVAMMSLTGLSIALATRSNRNAGRAFETGLLTQEIDRMVAAPIESLAVRLGQVQVDTPVTTPWPIARDIRISGRADSLTVRIAILPLRPVQQADSAVHVVVRTR